MIARRIRPEPSFVFGAADKSRDLAHGAEPFDAFTRSVSRVDQALLRGETLDAERLFAVYLGRPAERAAVGSRLDSRSAETLSLLALRIGEATQSGAWLDFVLRLYASTASVMPLAVVSGLHSLAQRLGGLDRTALRQYTAELERRATRSLEERAAIDRLQALATTRFGQRMRSGVFERFRLRSPAQD